MSEIINISDCRKIRNVINTLTNAPLLTKKEYIDLMEWANKVCDRLELENKAPDKKQN